MPEFTKIQHFARRLQSHSSCTRARFRQPRWRSPSISPAEGGGADGRAQSIRLRWDTDSMSTVRVAIAATQPNQGQGNGRHGVQFRRRLPSGGGCGQGGRAGEGGSGPTGRRRPHLPRRQAPFGVADDGHDARICPHGLACPSRHRQRTDVPRAGRQCRSGAANQGAGDGAALDDRDRNVLAWRRLEILKVEYSRKVFKLAGKPFPSASGPVVLVPHAFVTVRTQLVDGATGQPRAPRRPEKTSSTVRPTRAFRCSQTSLGVR